MSEKETAFDKYVRLRGYKLKDPLERMRFFCSIALNDQDWLDVESFFDDVLRDRQAKSSEIINGGGGGGFMGCILTASGIGYVKVRRPGS